MPSQFQPYYPRSSTPPATAAKQATSGQGAGLPVDKLIQAIQQYKQNQAAQALANDPDPDWLYTQPAASPTAVGQSPASYY